MLRSIQSSSSVPRKLGVEVYKIGTIELRAELYPYFIIIRNYLRTSKQNS